MIPSQYKVQKIVASKFCEAREDGLSLEGAYEFVAEASIFNHLKEGVCNPSFS
tara:strand:+ start:511 stop:669 length:159 start_codon:yes stop_codon:yes gene_type:complete